MTINELIEKHQFLAGAFFALAGGALTFIATSIKDFLISYKRDKKEDKLFRRTLYGELLALQMEFSQAIRNDDLAEIESYYSLVYLKMVESNYTLVKEGLETEAKKAQVKKETAKILQDVKARFISKIGLFFFIKNNKTKSYELLDQLTKVGMAFEVAEVKSKDLKEVVDLRYKQKIEYELFWRKEVQSVTIEMIECVLNNN